MNKISLQCLASNSGSGGRGRPFTPDRVRPNSTPTQPIRIRPVRPIRSNGTMRIAQAQSDCDYSPELFCAHGSFMQVAPPSAVAHMNV